MAELLTALVLTSPPGAGDLEEATVASVRCMMYHLKYLKEVFLASSVPMEVAKRPCWVL